VNKQGSDSMAVNGQPVKLHLFVIGSVRSGGGSNRVRRFDGGRVHESLKQVYGQPSMHEIDRIGHSVGNSR